MKKLLLLSILVFSVVISNAQNPVLYGLTNYGGAYDWGNIFKITSSGKLTVLHNFGDSTDGQAPFGSLVYATNGLLYGITQYGGAYGFGTIFSYNMATGVESDVHDFNADTNGYEPYNTRFIQVGDSLLYGLTMEGGDYDGGTIFNYNIYTGVTTRLYSFGIPPYQLDGYHPYSSLLMANNGLLYGTTQYGGTNGIGTIFSYNIATGTETKVHDFGSGTDGAWPVGAIIQANNGLLYGTTAGGGVDSDGIIFSYNITADTEIDVYDFKGGANGYQPYGSLVQAGNGLLYGLTSGGGTYDTSFTAGGTIFSFNTLTGAQTVLHSFGNNNDGAWPNGSLILASDSLLYGMTAYGGADSVGTVISFNISTGAETVLNSFDTTNGGEPTGDLLEVDSTGPYYRMFGYNHSWNVTQLIIVASPRNSSFEFWPYHTMTTLANDTSRLFGKLYYKATLDYATDTEFFREDTIGQKVWILTDSSGDEKLLYDFYLQKGDSAYLSFNVLDKSKGYYLKTGWYFVDSVKTVNIYAGARKALFLSNPHNNFDSIANQYPNDSVHKLLELEWIEQIGSTIMPDYLQQDITFYGFQFDVNWGFYDILMCSNTDNGKIYHSHVFDDLNDYIDDSCDILLGINQLSVNNSQITLYPNPTTGLVTISSTKNISNITVTNLLGQIILAQPNPLSAMGGLVSDKIGGPGVRQIDLSPYPAGMYFITVTSGGETETSKIILDK